MNIVDRQTFRDAMPCMGAVASIITTDGPARHAGFTASAVCSVTDTSPTLLMYLDHGASVWPIFNENRTLCINTFSAGQESLSNLLGGKTPTEHHSATTHWQTSVTGCPQLEEALVLFDCRISQVASVGTHDVLFCAIEAIHRRAIPYRPVRLNRSYYALMRPAC